MFGRSPGRPAIWPGLGGTAPDLVNDRGNHLNRTALAEAGWNHEIRSLSLQTVRHLPRKDRVKALPRHAGATKNALSLEEGWRADHSDRVHELVAAGFVEKRDIHHRQRTASRRLLYEEKALRGADQGMDDVLKAIESIRIVKHGLTKGFPIDTHKDAAAVGKSGEHRTDGGTTRHEKIVNGGIPNAWKIRPAVDFPMAIEPVRPRMKGMFLHSAAEDDAAEITGHLGVDAEPGGKAGAALMQQHAEAVDHNITPSVRCSQ